MSYCLLHPWLFSFVWKHTVCRNGILWVLGKQVPRIILHQNKRCLQCVWSLMIRCHRLESTVDGTTGPLLGRSVATLIMLSWDETCILERLRDLVWEVNHLSSGRTVGWSTCRREGEEIYCLYLFLAWNSALYQKLIMSHTSQDAEIHHRECVSTLYHLADVKNIPGIYSTLSGIPHTYPSFQDRH